MVTIFQKNNYPDALDHAKNTEKNSPTNLWSSENTKSKAASALGA